MIDTTRMTDRSRKVLQIAEEQARLRGATHVLPEHVLLGLYLEGAGVAANALRYLGVADQAIEDLLPLHHRNVRNSTQPLAWDEGVLQAAERALEEAKRLHHNYVGTEHLALGIVHTGGGDIPRILANLNITPESVHEEVYRLLGHWK